MTGMAASQLIEESRYDASDNGRVRRCYRLTDARLLCFIVGSMLLVASLLYFSGVGGGGGGVTVASGDGNAFMSVLLEDLMRRGLFKQEDQAVFQGNPSSAGSRSTFVDRTVDFILASDSSVVPDFGLADRTLKLGGVISQRLGEETFDMPPNYKLVYVQRFGGSTVVAMRKILHNAAEGSGKGVRRRLLTVANGAESDDVLLEPPAWRRLGRSRKRAAYVPRWDRSLDQHARLVFVDVGSPERARSEDWFKKNYYAAARTQTELEVVRLNVEEGGRAGSEGIAEWLAKNVKEEEYVVMKAEAEVAEEMVKEGGIGLVDEMFLECSSHQWSKGRKGSRRAYWECLSLYGTLKDKGVAVHQWWG